MPELLSARAPENDEEERKIRKLAGNRHALETDLARPHRLPQSARSTHEPYGPQARRKRRRGAGDGAGHRRSGPERDLHAHPAAVYVQGRLVG